MEIKKIYLTKSFTGFYFDDQKAIKRGAQNDGFMYQGSPVVEGFTQVRQKGEAISIQIVLENGVIGYGDCCAVQYSGVGGRDPLFLADDYIPFMEAKVIPLLMKEDIGRFRPLAEKYDRMIIDGKRLHTAIRYGITQAILSVTAKYRQMTMAELIRLEYNINNKAYKSIPVFTQSGDDRYASVDKMILKEVDVLPHALINSVPNKLGAEGEILTKYVSWLSDRILKYRLRPDYQPIIHLDVYGTIGIIFDNDLEKIVDYMLELERLAKPFKLRIEGPIDGRNREETMTCLRDLTIMLDNRRSSIEIVADEWCNTLEDIIYFADNKAGKMLQIKCPDLGGINNIIEAILYCNKKKIGSYCGGSCNETDISAKTTINIAIACDADQFLAKPGMGVDEGYMIIKNEMERVLAICRDRQ